MIASTLKYRSLLSEELQAVETMMLETLNGFPQNVADALANIIQYGGKRLRPALVILSSYIYGAAVQTALPVAAAVELLHTATLIHDDLIDDARLRRGASTLNANWTPAATVLAGDVAFAWAAQFAARGQNLSLMQRFSETLATICQGELNQMFEGRGTIPTEAAYYARIFAKTASLFALTTESGAILAQCTTKTVKIAHQFGKLLGEAFQIADDVLDFMGYEAKLGKPVGGDLRQGLITLPVLYYVRAYPDDKRIQLVLSQDADEATIYALVDDLRHSNAAEEAMADAEARIDKAVNLLIEQPNTPYRRAMEEIAAFAIHRQH